jgi:predicted peroxiredoxin
MKKSLLVLSSIIMLSTASIASENSAKGLNVIITSGDAQTQMMGMALSMATLKQKKEVNMTLCSKAGDLAVKGMESPVLKPMDKSPKMMLQALMKQGAKVDLCPIYLPNSENAKAELLEGITIATPADGAAKLLNKDYQNLSY